MAEVTAFGVVVRIEHDLIQLPLGSFRRSHSPAKANNSPSLTSKQYGCLVFPARNASRNAGLMAAAPTGRYAIALIWNPDNSLWDNQPPPRCRAPSRVRSGRLWPPQRRSGSGYPPCERSDKTGCTPEELADSGTSAIAVAGT